MKEYCKHCGAPLRNRNLTEQEEAIGRELLKGLSNDEIGKQLGIAGRTVKAHLAKMFRKRCVSMGRSPRVQLAVKLYEELNPAPMPELEAIGRKVLSEESRMQQGHV